MPEKGNAFCLVRKKGIIYYKLIESKQKVTAKLYSQKLIHFSQVLERKHTYRGKGDRKVILLHDSARLHVAKMTQSTIERLGWDFLSHPAYSPDLAPTDYHLFRSIELFFREKSFFKVQSIKKYLGSVF